MKGNKGEWSELYVLLRLLADGRLYSADEELRKVEDCYLPVLKVLRDEINFNKIEYRRSDRKYVTLYLNDARIRTISTAELAEAATTIFDAIERGSGAFSIDGADAIMSKLECKRIKAGSGDKTDITLQVHDPITNYNRICGYSIKSDLGGAPTLLNASRATNFRYFVGDMSDDEMHAINAIDTRSKIKDRMRRLDTLQFVSTVNETFSGNLLFVDSLMEQILSELLPIFYREGIADCTLLATAIEERNPLHYKRTGIYRHKLKKFLCAVALGLNPSKQWSGIDEANGGYIIVTESGDVIAYHLYNRDSFETYLLNHTKLETPSTGKHDFASIYVGDDNRKYINLNLQIRFK